MSLWLCWYVNDEWGCYIIAPTRGRAKSMFNLYWGSICFGEYTDVRATKIKAADEYEEAVLDMDCETLAAREDNRYQRKKRRLQSA